MHKSYTSLKDHFAHINKLKAAKSLLDTDMNCTAPEGARPTMGEISASIAETCATLNRDNRIEGLLNEAESIKGKLSVWDQRNLQLMRRSWQEDSAVPPSLIGEYYRAANICNQAWEEAKPKGDFKIVEEPFKRLLLLTNDIAQARVDSYLPGKTTYEALIDTFDPGRTTAEIDTMFADLESFLPSFADEVIEKQKSEGRTRINATIPEEKQLAACRDLADVFQFDMNRGRLAEYDHPFSSGIRNYTWFVISAQPDSFLSNCYSACAHELGHALYTQGQPEEYSFQAVGEDAGIMIHETQSLLMERHVSKSPLFMQGYLPRLQKIIGDAAKDWTVDSVVNSLNVVEKSFIRIEADEVTYPLHVILRYRLEKALVEGDLSIHDLPGAWNDMFQKYFGLTPPSHTQGCLQDIHWFSPVGIGYFPSYTLGAMYGAQMFKTAVTSTPEIIPQLRQADVTALLQWLRENIHEQGNLYEPDDLIQRATGKAPSAQDFKDYLKATYLDNHEVYLDTRPEK